MCLAGQPSYKINNAELIEVSEFPSNAEMYLNSIDSKTYLCVKHRDSLAIYKLGFNAKNYEQVFCKNNFADRVLDFYYSKIDFKNKKVLILTDDALLSFDKKVIVKYEIPKEYLTMNFDRLSVCGDNQIILYHKNADLGNKVAVGLKFKLANKKLIPVKKYKVEINCDLLSVYANQNSVLISDNKLIEAPLYNRSLLVNNDCLSRDNGNQEIISNINRLSKLYKIDPTYERLSQLDVLDAGLCRNINVFADRLYIYKVSRGKQDASGSSVLTLDVFDKSGMITTFDSFAFMFMKNMPDSIYEHRISQNDFPLYNLAFKRYLINNGHIYSFCELPSGYNPNGKTILEINKDVYFASLNGTLRKYVLINRIPGLIYCYE
jgi:hypothetical protein